MAEAGEQPAALSVGWLGRGNVCLHPPASSVPSSLLPCPLQNSWVPRRGDQGPKTIDQIHKEAEMEEHREHIKVQQLMSKDKRRGPPGPSSSGECLGSGAPEAAGGVGCSCWGTARGQAVSYICPPCPRWAWKPGGRRWLEHSAHQQGQPTH